MQPVITESSVNFGGWRDFVACVASEVRDVEGEQEKGTHVSH